VRLGYKQELDRLTVADYLICNWDRHDRNVEMFCDTKKCVDIFDNGCSMGVNHTDKEIGDGYTWSDNARVNSFYEAFLTEHLDDLEFKFSVRDLTAADRKVLFDGLDLGAVREDFMWTLINRRIQNARKLKIIL
jgi:hypothetical protein